MGRIGIRTILVEGQRWAVQVVVEVGIAVEPDDPFAPEASKLYPITFTSHQTGVVRRGMLRTPRSRATEADLEDAFKRSYSEAPAPPSP